MLHFASPQVINNDIGVIVGLEKPLKVASDEKRILIAELELN